MRQNRKRQIHRKHIVYIERCSIIIATCFIIFFSVFSFGGFFSQTDSVQAKEDTHYKYYKSIVIEKGDTLTKIAKTYRTDSYDSLEDYIAELKEINHLKSDTIYENNHLIIVYYNNELQ